MLDAVVFGDVVIVGEVTGTGAAEVDPVVGV